MNSLVTSGAFPCLRFTLLLLCRLEMVSVVAKSAWNLFVGFHEVSPAAFAVVCHSRLLTRDQPFPGQRVVFLRPGWHQMQAVLQQY